MTSLLIVEDDEAMRYLLRRLAAGCTVVGEAMDGPDALEAVEKLRPDVILLDVSLPTMSGFAVAELLRTRHPETHVIFVTMHSEPIYADEAFRLGARGYVIKRAAPRELPAAIQAAVAGDLFRSPLIGD